MPRILSIMDSAKDTVEPHNEVAQDINVGSKGTKWKESKIICSFAYSPCHQELPYLGSMLDNGKR